MYSVSSVQNGLLPRMIASRIVLPPAAVMYNDSNTEQEQNLQI